MIYIAAPLFSKMETDYIDKIVLYICEKLNLDICDFYIPHRNNNYYDNDSTIYDKNYENLNGCDIMIAILDGKDTDSGTAFEIGYFEAQDKIVLGLLTDTRSYNDNHELNEKLNTMIFGSCNYGELIFNQIDDLVEELNDILMGDEYENYL